MSTSATPTPTSTSTSTATSTPTSISTSTTIPVMPTPSPSSKKDPKHPVVSDGLMDLLASKIDYLEGKGKTTSQQQGNGGATGDEFELTASELSDVAAREAHIRSLLIPSSDDNTESISTNNNIQVVIDLFISECRAHILSQRHGNLYREKYARICKQKDRLESLCRELQTRNKNLQDEMRTSAMEQARIHTELKTKFEGSLSDISEQLKKHTEDRIKQHEDNDKLRENLNQLLKYESVREEHFNHQLRTKELEHQLMEAKMRQQMEFAAQESRKVQLSEERILQLQEIEVTLRAQLQGYADKFAQVQATLSKSNELFSTFKSEMEKMSKQMKKLEKEKKIAETKNNESQLTIIQMFEERTSDRKLIEKYQRQKDKLQALCLEYEKERKTHKLLAERNVDGGDANSTPVTPTANNFENQPPSTMTQTTATAIEKEKEKVTTT